MMMMMIMMMMMMMRRRRRRRRRNTSDSSNPAKSAEKVHLVIKEERWTPALWIIAYRFRSIDSNKFDLRKLVCEHDHHLVDQFAFGLTRYRMQRGRKSKTRFEPTGDRTEGPLHKKMNNNPSIIRCLSDLLFVFTFCDLSHGSKESSSGSRLKLCNPLFSAIAKHTMQ